MAASDGLLLKIVNVLVLIFLISSNAYVSVMPDYGGANNGAGGKETYITPAPYAFYVWTIINLTLIGEIVLQFFQAGEELVVKHIGWRFAIVGLLNAIYAHLYAAGHYIPAFIVVIFLASSISVVYWSLRSHSPQGALQTVLVYLPWSLWHAWSVVLVIVTGFAAFGRNAHSHGHHGASAGVWTRLLVCVALAFLASTSVGYAFQSSQGDIAGAAVIAWTLLAIFSQQHHPAVIHWFALGAFIVSALAVLKAAVTAFRGRGSGLATDGERAPLIGSE